MKTIWTAAIAMAAIILVRTAVSLLFGEPAAESFGYMLVMILFYVYLFKSVSRKRAAAN